MLLQTPNQQLNNKVLLVGGNNGTARRCRRSTCSTRRSRRSARWQSMPAAREGHTIDPARGRQGAGDGRQERLDDARHDGDLRPRLRAGLVVDRGNDDVGALRATPRRCCRRDRGERPGAGRGRQQRLGTRGDRGAVQRHQHLDGDAGDAGAAVAGSHGASARQQHGAGRRRPERHDGAGRRAPLRRGVRARVLVGEPVPVGLLRERRLLRQRLQRRLRRLQPGGHARDVHRPRERHAAGAAAAGGCDVAETCNGSSFTCPADAFAPSTTVCRDGRRVCDLAESCTGTSAACPADAKKPSGTACTDDGNACTHRQLQRLRRRPASTRRAMRGRVCRAAGRRMRPGGDLHRLVGDLPGEPVQVERLGAAPTTATSARATPATARPRPASTPAGNAGTQCRTAAGVCDLAATCTGSSATCPANPFKPSSTVCRASAGVCDVAETCTGSSAACPANAFASPSIVCRAASGQCDVAETCTGASSACPGDALASNGTHVQRRQQLHRPRHLPVGELHGRRRTRARRSRSRRRSTRRRPSRC